MIELGAVVHVEYGCAARRKPLLDERIELLCQQVERHVAALEGVDQDQVVGVLAAVEEHASVTVEVAHAWRLDEPEIFFRRLDYAAVDLDGIDARLRHETS